ncbi:uncharacterized protein [Symphalangus syndactylus]|uniref:uncharacterized protein isoform X2 n=1 Tax=Symphalangus syndactylus TaxID=9590 RepID=UPI0024410E62|nr:uncharacterized protein LOC129486398 isoform X2 [Symphalangus syndactylus]
MTFFPCPNQDHGEVPVVHRVVVQGFGWDAELGWQSVIVLKGTFVRDGIRDKIKHKPKPWPRGKAGCGVEKRRCRLALLLLPAHIIKRRSLSWSVGCVRPKVLIFLLLGQPSVSEQEPESLNVGSRGAFWGLCARPALSSLFFPRTLERERAFPSGRPHRRGRREKSRRARCLLPAAQRAPPVEGLGTKERS